MSQSSLFLNVDDWDGCGRGEYVRCGVKNKGLFSPLPAHFAISPLSQRKGRCHE